MTNFLWGLLLTIYLAPPAMAGLAAEKEPFIGYGVDRTLELATYPIRHPLVAAVKATYPFRHPLKAFENFGKATEKYQPALQTCSYLAAPAAAIGIFRVGKF